MEEVAFTYHWPPSELRKLTVRELINWHDGARRINRQLHPGPQS
ncbi:GpE family phage tail protein [Marivibrio sp.]